jgi:endoglucanase
MKLRLTALPLLIAAAAGVLWFHPQADAQERDAFHYNKLLGRGANLGNALEAPREGEWGMVLREEYFDLLRTAGFQSVRIPIRWSAHAAAEAPYTIDPTFFRRVDWAIDQALRRGLTVVINIHHYDEIFQDPDAHEARFTGIWRQIAERYRDRPDRLYFELLNEPHNRLTDERWNTLFPDVLRVVRESNPRRVVIVGPGNWNNVERLPNLRLPESDRLLIATFHYYHPFRFTHQGAEWVEGSNAWLGTTWRGTEEEMAAVRTELAGAARWAEEQRRPLYLGEFGSYSRADLESRTRWTAAVAREAERQGMSWAYWEFGAGFGVYDRDAGVWRRPLLQALVPGALGRTPMRRPAN